MARKLLLAVAIAGAATWSCAPEQDRYVDLSPTRQVFTVAFENLAERHINPFQPGPAALAGLAELTTLDDRLAIDWSGRTIKLSEDGVTIAEHPTPTPDNLYGWAEVTAAVIADARLGSPVLAAKPLEEIHQAVFTGVLRSRDKYTRYLTPDEARESRASRDGFGGIGVTIDIEEDQTVIRRVHEDTPAARAGLKAGDQITAVDGRSIVGMPMRAVVRLLRGRVNDPVALTIVRRGVSGELRFDMVRDHIVPQSVRSRLRDGIVDITLTSFNQGTARAVRHALVSAARQARGAVKGIVLDLRGNPGGLLDQAVAVSDIFLNEGRIISTRGRHEESNQIFDATPGQILDSTPMVVLINGRSASAAEIVAVALRDDGRAVLLGTSSYGKGTVQTIVRLPNNGELIITWARLHAPSGQTLDHKGIVPAICTDAPHRSMAALLSALRSGKDPALSPAVLQRSARETHYSIARHNACPPAGDVDARDLEAAHLLLANKPLYAAAIARPPANIAKR